MGAVTPGETLGTYTTSTSVLIKQGNTSLRDSVLGPHPEDRGGVSGELLRVSRAVSLTPTGVRYDAQCCLRAHAGLPSTGVLPPVSHRQVSALVSAWPPLMGSIQNVISRTGCCVAQQLRPVVQGCCTEHAATPPLGKGCARSNSEGLPRGARRNSESYSTLP